MNELVHKTRADQIALEEIFSNHADNIDSLQQSVLPIARRMDALDDAMRNQGARLRELGEQNTGFGASLATTDADMVQLQQGLAALSGQVDALKPAAASDADIQINNPPPQRMDADTQTDTAVPPPQRITQDGATMTDNMEATKPKSVTNANTQTSTVTMPSPDSPPPYSFNQPAVPKKRDALVMREAAEPSQSNYFTTIQILQDRKQTHPPLPNISGHKKRRVKKKGVLASKKRRK
jgi:hypothetical protein